MRSTHLGDGAYITQLDDGGFVVTAKHHDPDKATSRVYIHACAMSSLIEFVQNPDRGEKT